MRGSGRMAGWEVLKVVFVVIGLLSCGVPLSFGPAAGERADATGGRAAGDIAFSQMTLPYNPEFNHAAWLPDGSSMVVAARGGWTLRYDPMYGTFTNITPSVPFPGASFNRVAMNPTTGAALVVGNMGAAILVSPDNNVDILSTGTTNDLYGAAFKPDGSCAYVAGANATLLRFDPGAGKFTLMDEAHMTGFGSIPSALMLGSIAFSANGSRALLPSPDGRVFRMADSGIEDVSSRFAGIGSPCEVAWAPDGSNALIACSRPYGFIWNGTTETAAVTSNIPDTAFKSVAWRNSTQAYYASEGSVIRVLRYSGSQILVETQQLGTGSPRALSWRPDGNEAFLFINGTSRAQVYRYRPSLLDPVLSVSGVTDAGAYLSWTWNGSAPVDHTNMYCSTSSASLFATMPINVSANAYCTLSSLKPEQNYFAAVTVYFRTPVIEAHSSNIVSFTTLAVKQVPPPTAPSVSDVNATAALLSWSWNPGVSGEQLDHFLLLYSTSAVSLPTETPVNVYTNTSGTLSRLSPSTTYYLMMRVVTRTNRTANSDVQSFTTAAFTVPQAVNLTVSASRLQWKASASADLRTYEVYHSGQAGQPVDRMLLLGTRSPSPGELTFDLSTYLGSTLKEGPTYYFKVRTINRDGGTADSNEVSWKYDTAPTPVAGTSITDVTYKSARLRWSRSSAGDFAAYVIDCREYYGGTWKTVKRVASQNTTSAVIEPLAPDTTYQFRIKVQDKSGQYSTASEWPTRPHTPENVLYSIFYGVLYTPEVCLPVSFVLAFMSFGITMGASKGGKRRGRALVGFAFTGGFGLVLLANLAWVLDIFTAPLELKVVLFLIPFPIAAAVGIARWSRTRATAAREAEELRRRQAEMAQQELRQRTDKVRATLEGLRSRIAAVDAMPKAPSTGTARDSLQRAGYAFQSGNILLAEEEGKRCEALVLETEAGAKDKQTQVAELTKRLDAMDGKLKTLIERWQNANPAAELGLDPLKMDRGRLEAARSEQDKRIQAAQAKAQQAGVNIEKDRLPEAREAATAAEAEVEKLLKAGQDGIALREKVLAVKSEIEKAGSWATLDKGAYGRRIEGAKLALAYDDLAQAENLLAGLTQEMGSLDSTYTPSIAVSLPSAEFQINRYDDLFFTVRNEGKALARNIEIGLEAPADFGPGKSGQLVKVATLMAGETKDCRINLCFLREGKVPVIMTIGYEDHNGNKITPEPQRLAANVVKEKGASQAVAPAAPVPAPKGNVLINARPILQGGFFLYKLAVINHGGLGMADARVLLSYKREILRFHHISPPTLLDRFKYLLGEGEREDVFYLGYLDPMKDQEVTAELYFHPYICTETVIEAELCYRDVQGRKLTIPCEPKKFPCYCPTLGSTEAPNPAMLLSFIATAGVKDSRVEPINTGVSLATAFDVLKSVITNFGLAPVGTERVKNAPYHAEALFYGEEDDGAGKMLRYAVIGMVTERPAAGPGSEVGGIAEIHVACEARTKVTALLATLAERFNSALEKQVNIKRPIYVDMREYSTVIKDSIIYKSSIGAVPGGVEVEGSVLARTSVQAPAGTGPSFSPSAGMGPIPQQPAVLDGKTRESMAKYQESYRRAKFNDGIIDEEEHAFLEHLATMFALPPETIKSIEARVDSEYEEQMARTGPPAGPRCPRCGASVRPGDVICSNCGDLLGNR